MNLGFFTMPIHPLEKDWRVSLREDREAFILADELGYKDAKKISNFQFFHLAALCVFARVIFPPLRRQNYHAYISNIFV